MVQAAIGAAAGLLGNQTRRSMERPEPLYISPLIAIEKDKKKINQIKKAAAEDRLLYFLSQPELMGILITMAGIYASQNIPFSSNEITNEGLQSIATMSSVLIGLGYAGVGDLTTLLAAAVAGGVSLTDFFTSGGGNKGIYELFNLIKTLLPIV